MTNLALDGQYILVEIGHDDLGIVCRYNGLNGLEVRHAAEVILGQRR